MKRLIPILFFAAVMVLAFWKVIFHEEYTFLTGSDMCAQSYPWFQVASFWLKKGVLLLWDPYVYCGKATLGELQPGILYPVNWIFMLLPVEGGGIHLGGMEALIILHYFMSAYFCYCLARSMGQTPEGAAVSGIAFALGGFVAQLYGFLNIFSSFTWMPLVFLLARKAVLADGSKDRIRFGVWSGFFLSISFLAGHHVPPIHAALLLVFYAIFLVFRDWSRSGWGARIRLFATFSGIGAFAALLSAVQWLPSLEWGRVVWRWIGDAEPIRWGEKIPYEVLQRTGNLDPQEMLSLALPYVSTHTNMYVGVAVLFLALVGFLFVDRSETRFFGVAAVVYLLFCWGGFTVLHGWLNTFVPGVWFAREGYHYQVPFQLCLALLAGWGLEHLVVSYAMSPGAGLKTFIRRAGWGLASLVLVATTLMMVNFQQNVPMQSPYQRVLAGLAAYLFILGFMLFLLHTGRIGARRFGHLIVLLVIVDLASQFSGDIRTESQPRGRPNPSVQAYWREPLSKEFLKARRREEYFRVDDPAQIFPPNFGDAWLMEATMGHGATALVRYLDFREIGWGPGSNASALLNARYFVSRIPVAGMEKVFQGEGEDGVYLNPRATPRVFVAGRHRVFQSEEEILRWIYAPMFAPRETVLVLEKDFRTLSESFRRGAREERDGIEVSYVGRRTAADKEAERVTDEQARHNLSVYQPPWGWSIGDEAEIVLRARRPASHCYLTVSYYPAGADPGNLNITLRGAEGASVINMQLPGLPNEGSGLEMPLQSSIDLGVVKDQEYRVSFTKTEACSARLDSLRLSEAEPAQSDRAAGSARITSFKPNRIRVETELARPAFVVISEVFYPGWEARIDGSAAPLLPADFILRAVPVPAGKHEIELRYRPRSFFWGLSISLVSLSGMAFYLLHARRRR